MEFAGTWVSVAADRSAVPAQQLLCPEDVAPQYPIDLDSLVSDFTDRVAMDRLSKALKITDHRHSWFIAARSDVKGM